MRSSRSHINSIIRLMRDRLNEQAIKTPLVTQWPRAHTHTHTAHYSTHAETHTVGECLIMNTKSSTVDDLFWLFGKLGYTDPLTNMCRLCFKKIAAGAVSPIWSHQTEALTVLSHTHVFGVSWPLANLSLSGCDLFTFSALIGQLFSMRWGFFPHLHTGPGTEYL